MLHNEIDLIRTRWSGHQPPTGDCCRVGRPSPSRGGHRRHPSFYGARDSPSDPSTPSKSSKPESPMMDRKHTAHNRSNFLSLTTVPEAGISGGPLSQLPPFSFRLCEHCKTQIGSHIASVSDSSLRRGSAAGVQNTTRIPAPAPTLSSTFISQRGERTFNTTLSHLADVSSPAANASSSSRTSPSPLSYRQRSQTLPIRGLPTADTEHGPLPCSPTPAPRERFPRNVGHDQYSFDEETMSPFGSACISVISTDPSHADTEAVHGSGATSNNARIGSSDNTSSGGNNTSSGGSNTTDNATPGTSADMDSSQLYTSNRTKANSGDRNANFELDAQDEQSEAHSSRTLIHCAYSKA